MVDQQAGAALAEPFSQRVGQGHFGERLGVDQNVNRFDGGDDPFAANNAKLDLQGE